jgi:hypothetical protein
MLPPSLIQQLTARHVLDQSEVALRERLEQQTETYTLIRLAPWPARRWKCRYRLMIGDTLYDAQSPSEAYALALLALLQLPVTSSQPSDNHAPPVTLSQTSDNTLPEEH